MNEPTPLTTLLGLRYRLLWATARTRTGRIALFVVGYLAAMLAAGFLLLGGIGTATAAIRTGQAELVFRVAFGGTFVGALLASTVLGVSVGSAFTEASLRRFPIGKLQRFVVRHLTGILDPLWLLVLALSLGLAIGAASPGAGAAWLDAAAAALLVASNYLAAQIVLGLVDNVMRTRAGRTALAVVVLLGVCLIPAVAMFADIHSPGIISVAAAVASLTPPFMAAAVLGGHGTSALTHILGLLACTGALIASLMAVERWQPVQRSGRRVAAARETPHDRMARLFGPALAPLAGKMLRYCTRSPQVRLAAMVALPSFALFIVTGRQGSTPFAQALPAFALFAGTAAGPVALNLFGFDGSGFRRYLLLPVTPTRILLVASAVVLVPGAAFIPAALVFWTVCSPAHTDLRSLAMLAGSGVVGWLAYPTIGVWTSVLAPTAIEFDRTWGNKLSLAANAAMAGSIVAFFAVVLTLHGLGLGGEALVRYWWVTWSLVPPAVVAYGLSLRWAGRAMTTRRERMLESIDPV